MSATPTVTGQSCPSLKCQGQRKSFRWLLRLSFIYFYVNYIDNVKHVLCMCIHSLKRVRATNFCFPRSWAFQLLKRFAALFGKHFVRETLRNSACSTSQKTLSMYLRDLETVSMRPQPLNPPLSSGTRTWRCFDLFVGCLCTRHAWSFIEAAALELWGVKPGLTFNFVVSWHN